MRISTQGLGFVMTLLATSALAAQPPDVVQGDASGNTAMGTNALFSLGAGHYNTGAGERALESNSDSDGNTAFGFWALRGNTTGGANTAAGFQSLMTNTTGSWNTAFGLQALTFNTSGDGNTAVGYQALISNLNGNYNTATGNAALSTNSTGSDNTATGSAALYPNTTGNGNTATASAALGNNTTGSYNTATGFASLNQNTVGSNNSATGVNTLSSNTTGIANTALGFNALTANRAGSNNVAIGAHAGENIDGGSLNIDVGNAGLVGDAGTIRIGTQGQQTRAYVAGVWATPVRHGASVVIGPDGRLGVEVSSERFKSGVSAIGDTSERMGRLRAVSYHLDAEPTDERRFGLIAEEVASVFPELAIRDERGQVEGVRYNELNAILLNEIQRQHQLLETQAARLSALESAQAGAARVDADPDRARGQR